MHRSSVACATRWGGVHVQCSAAQRSAVAARVTALRISDRVCSTLSLSAHARSAVAFTGKELETYVGRGGCFAFPPDSEW
jgi:hypothetical protein